MQTSSDFPEKLPSPVIKRSGQGLSWVWIVPLLAILVGLGLAFQAIRARGPEITLQFALAEGLEANKTRIKFKDVDIGTVKTIALNPDRKSIKVTAQMDKAAEGLLVEDSRFWVVRPRVVSGNISGLATLLSGAYIAVDPGLSGDVRHDFVGLDVPPLITSDTPGRQYLLKVDDLGSLNVGAPVYYRRVQVGRVISYAMAKDGQGIDMRIFVDAPYHEFVRQTSRFWHASGIDVSMDANGVKLNMQSLASLAFGGVAFSSPDNDENEPVPSAEPEASFVLHADRASATRVPDSIVQKYMLTFRESLRGLGVGAPVDFKGITVGEVSKINLVFDQKKTEFSMRVEVNLYPERFVRKFRSHGGSTTIEKEMHDIFDKMVAKGFRAQLRTGGLINGNRYVALDYFPGVRTAKVDWKQSAPELPTQPGVLDSLQDQLLSIVESLHQTLEHVDHLVVRIDRELTPELASTLRDARKTLSVADQMLGSANQTLGSDAPLPLEMRETLREVAKAATAVRNLADLLERQPEALLTGKKGD